MCDDPAYQHQLAEPTAALLAEIVGGRPDTTAVVATTSTTAKNVIPRLAALLDVAQISDIAAVVSADTFVRPIYAGNAMATVKSRDAIKVITVRTTLFDAAKAEGGGAPSRRCRRPRTPGSRALSARRSAAPSGPT